MLSPHDKMLIKCVLRLQIEEWCDAHGIHEKMQGTRMVEFQMHHLQKVDILIQANCDRHYICPTYTNKNIRVWYTFNQVWILQCKGNHEGELQFKVQLQSHYHLTHFNINTFCNCEL